VRGLELLTPREREVMQLVADGNTNQEIAQLLHLSPLTAKTHV
jgi:DNA-binding CsgD family transcriptional regulator